MDNEKENKSMCAACFCQCDMHKEHNHLVSAEGGEKHEEAKTCSFGGHENKQDGKSDCGCK